MNDNTYFSVGIVKGVGGFIWLLEFDYSFKLDIFGYLSDELVLVPS